MRTLSMLLMLISLGTFAQENGTIKVKKTGSELVIMDQWDSPPSLPDLYNIIAQNLVYPDSALARGNSGICYVSFVVTSEGNVAEVKVLRGVPGCPECDEVALSAVRKLPKFEPALKNSKAVNVKVTLPVKFRLK